MRPLPLRRLLVLLPAGLLWLGCGGASGEAVQQALQSRTAADSTQGDAGDALAAFYAERDFEPLWAGPKKPTRQAEELLAQVCATTENGMALGRSDLDAVTQAVQAAYAEGGDDAQRAQAIADAEVAFTQLFLAYSGHLANGSVAPDELKGQWHLEKEPPDARVLLRAADDDGVEATLEALARQHAGYEATLEALDRYRQIQERGGWPAVPGGDALEVGASGERVAALRRRLAATGDLADTTASDVFDASLAEAVQRFQRRHGLVGDGVVGAGVLEALNVPVEQRIEQLELNMERRRWLPTALGEDYVYVNIPDYTLYGYRGGDEVITMPVVVGQRMNQTPVFADTMTHVIFRPYWNVPPSIATEEILPKVQADPGYLARNDYEVVGSSGNVVNASLSSDALERSDVRIRQKPGRSNALGRVKYMFPNDYNIYLHDTPADHLFSREDRSFSHGCIRLERPADFGVFVLQGQDGWTKEKIEQEMNADGTEERVDLDDPLPVYLVYMTAWVDDDGTVHFRDDVYGLDPSLRQALAAASAPETKQACTALHDQIQELR